MIYNISRNYAPKRIYNPKYVMLKDMEKIGVDNKCLSLYYTIKLQ